MAMKDVKKYYWQQLVQYLEMKDILDNMEKEFAKGYYTEEKINNVKSYVDNLKINLDRVGYVMFLFEMPKKKEKQLKFLSQNKALVKEFSRLNADSSSILDENKSVLDLMRVELKKMQKENNK